jgi:hypothetical protein
MIYLYVNILCNICHICAVLTTQKSEKIMHCLNHTVLVHRLRKLILSWRLPSLKNMLKYIREIFVRLENSFGKLILQGSAGFTQMFFSPMLPHVPYGLCGLPSACGRSVTDVWGWDAHEAQLRCPGEVVGDIWIWSTRRGLKPKFY